MKKFYVIVLILAAVIMIYFPFSDFYLYLSEMRSKDYAQEMYFTLGVLLGIMLFIISILTIAWESTKGYKLK